MGVSHLNIIPHREGATQIGRLSEKLLPDYVKIDERTLGELLAFIADYSAYFDFYNEKSLPAGNWQPFFLRDITVFLASVMSTDLKKWDGHFEHHVQKVEHSFKENEKADAFVIVFKELYQMARRIDAWYKHSLVVQVTGGKLEENTSLELRKVIEQNLRVSLQQLQAFGRSAAKVNHIIELSSLTWEPFHEIWQLKENDEDLPKLMQGNESINEKLNNALVQLRSVYRNFFNNLAYVIAKFTDFYNRSLEEKQDHKPDVALFIVFLKLFRHTQDELNDLTRRHLDYYFEEVLGQLYRDAKPDQVHLCMELARNVWSYRIDEGTQIYAGLDENGDDLLFSVDNSVELNRAEIESVRSVYVSRILENQIGTYKLITNIYSAPFANSKDGHGEPFDTPNADWSLFGEEQYKSGLTTMTPADIGFAISSPVLDMSEGNRKVRIQLNFKEESTKIYKKLIQDVAEERRDEAYRYAFFEIFGRDRKSALKILLSGPDGWIDINDVNPNSIFFESPKPWNWHSFTINFTVPAASPAITSFNPRVFRNENFQGRFPVVKFLLNHQRTPYIYSFIDRLELSSVSISVEVDKLRSFNIYNELGRLDETQPFQAFGAIPKIGSYLLIGNPELFRKNLEEVAFHVEWQNIPREGLERYYSSYFPAKDPNRIRESRFKVAFSALSGHEFKPQTQEPELEYPLFEKGLVTTDFRLNELDKFNILVNPTLRDIDIYDSHTESGFFKMELIDPPEVFGHSLYQEKLIDVAQHNSDMNTPAEDRHKYPNQPIAPLIKTLTASYRATDSISLEKMDSRNTVQIYHVHPFGPAAIHSPHALLLDKMFLMPQYREDAYTYIGLKDLQPPQEISILFQMVTSNTQTTVVKQMPTLQWSFLGKNNRWEEIKDTDILGDTTDGFTTTGIVRLQIPSRISRRAEILPSGGYWLRVALTGDSTLLCRAIALRSQAVSATWISNGNSQRLDTPLPANTVMGLRYPVPQIRKVFQPYPSFNGQKEEGRYQFYQRVSERLRHKNRAVSHWDFERLVLNRFHTISQVKALSYLTNPTDIPPGEVRVVVVPGANYASEEMTPKVNYKTLLSIQEYLQNHASPFVKIQVVNPVYEFIRVICSVKFTEGNNNGYSLERLKNDIRDFICPWLSDQNAYLEIGGSLKLDAVINFVKGLPYVKFVTRFAMLQFYISDEETGEYSYHHTADPNLTWEQRETVEATKPWAVLIPDNDHQFEIITREIEMAPEFHRRPVSFQNRVQITHKIIKIKRLSFEDEASVNSYYEPEDTLTFFI